MKKFFFIGIFIVVPIIGYFVWLDHLKTKNNILENLYAALAAPLSV